MIFIIGLIFAFSKTISVLDELSHSAFDDEESEWERF